jgi:dTMP kinase
VVHVAVEGLDGAGKSTLIDGLRARLGGRFEVGTFVLPDPDAFAGRDLVAVVSRELPSPSADVLALGFAVNRLASYESRLRPWLADRPDRIALSHRYVLSGLAYQSADGVALPWLLRLNERMPPPDLTIFIDTKPAVCEERVGSRHGGAELFESRFTRMRSAFLAAIDVLRERGWRIEVVDGGAAPAELADTAAALIARHAP